MLLISYLIYLYAKIIDENRNETDELKFQLLDDDNDESLQMRLNDLYKRWYVAFS